MKQMLCRFALSGFCGMGHGERHDQAIPVRHEEAVFYVPALQWIIRTEPITLGEWGDVLMVAVTVIIVVEIDTWTRRRRAHA